MDFNKFRTMKPMKYIGGTAGASRVKQFLANPEHYSDWYYSGKADGEWARIVYDLEGNVVIQGRGISRATGQHKDNTELVPHLVEDIKANLRKGTVLIGEFSFKEHENFVQRDIGSILRCKAPKAIERQKDNKLFFHTFDCLAYDGLDLSDATYQTRQAVLKGIKTDYIVPIIPKRVDEGALEYLDKILADGGEGIMIMNKDGKYLPGSRSVSVSLKIKKELDEMTLPVIGLVDPTVKYEGGEAETWPYSIDGQLVTKQHYLGHKAGVIVDFNGNEVRITSGANDADREWLASDEAKQMIENGELMADVIAMEIFTNEDNDKQSLRHPVLLKLRTDL